MYSTDPTNRPCLERPYASRKAARDEGRRRRGLRGGGARPIVEACPFQHGGVTGQVFHPIFPPAPAPRRRDRSEILDFGPAVA